jgi:ABC-type transport system substrate-binding protein
MRAQLVELDQVKRKALFDDVQRILAEQLPMIFLVSPNILVGAREDLGNFSPTILDHSTLWNAEMLFWRNGPPVN